MIEVEQHNRPLTIVELLDKMFDHETDIMRIVANGEKLAIVVEVKILEVIEHVE
jgi:hypothetical protein